MTKTRSQSLNLVIKKEEHEDKPKLEQMLHSANNASKNKSKITKNRKPVQAQNAKVKSENVNDNKALLASPKKILRRSSITAEQIAKLIGHVVNDKISVKAAARKAGINYYLALEYYQGYKVDPEHKLPVPKTRLGNPLSARLTQQKINSLIRYIVNDGMNVTQAAKKLDINRNTAVRYYTKYRQDPERKIPLLADHTGDSSKRCTQEEIAELIGYIVRDKMSLPNASKRVNMSYSTAQRYYLKYLQNLNRGIPNPCESNSRHGRSCTNDQVSSLIGYIVNHGMTPLKASIKANMGINTARRYYQQYLDDPKKNIPTPETNSGGVSINPPTFDQVKSFFCYIIINKLNVQQAACKAKITRTLGRRYYNKYLKDPNSQTKIKDMTYSANKMKRLVELVQNKKMSLSKAADAVDLNIKSARKYYQQYLEDPQYEFPAIYHPQYTQEDIQRLIEYIERDKMSVRSAAKEIKMSQPTAFKYYKIYQNDPEHKVPVPMIRGHTEKNKTFEKYAQIIADIYKNNPLIEPVYENHDPELDTLDIEIKKELKEEDTKLA